MIRHKLNLEYTLSAGWMAPFVEALTEGRAMARRCTDCAAVSFPPLRTCPCGCTTADWTQLPGTATITYRTDGTDGSFGLVRFDGAGTQAVARLQDFASDDRAGHLQPLAQVLPALILHPHQKVRT
jgi:uncharacterized OB-fold protein